jgi:acyl-lipid omega-6 desaturase (Delta-12 desaturase)
LPTNSCPPHPERRLQRPCRAHAAAPAVAEPRKVAAADIGKLSEAERTALAQQWGFRSIGKDLPAGTKLTDIVRSLPREVFQINAAKSWGACLTSLLAFPASLALIHASPAWFLPIAWLIAGTAFTGWFVIGHDCGHRSFHPNRLVEDIVGNFFFAPLLYPFEPWRIKHNQHHAFTNKLEDDTAWHPVMKEEAKDLRQSGWLGASLRRRWC